VKAGLILARLDSSRFPNKAITDLGDKKLVQWCIDGVKNAGGIEPILVTTTRVIDSPLIEVAKLNNIKFFKGDFENVAKRIFDCIHHFDIDIFARINGDSPFVNKILLDKALNLFDQDTTLDFVTNLLPRKFPYGLSVELMRSKTYKKYYNELKSLDYQEHITKWFYENLDLLNIFKLHYSYGNVHYVRFTVDTIEDHTNLEKFIHNNPNFDFYNSTVHELVSRYTNKETIYK